jgi:hypothetical protein
MLLFANNSNRDDDYDDNNNNNNKHTKDNNFVAYNLWVVLRRLVFKSRRFGTLCLFHLHGRVDMNMFNNRRFGYGYPLAHEDGTDTVFRNVGY